MKLGWANVCLSFPYGESYHVDCRKVVESLILGIGDGLGHHKPVLEEGWIKKLRLFFAEGEEYFPEILLGVQAAKSILGERIQIKILASSESPYPQNTKTKT
jgi:hypothetical protein